MREIKFRAWHKEKKKMVAILDFSFITDTMHYSSDDFERIPCRETDWDEIDKFIVMLFTGLKDVNGKDIYEGDILYDPMYNVMHAVKWNSDIAGFSLDNGFPLYKKLAEYCKVVGNIYENPELLGGDNNE
jgi:uncharacterized phage protein (TIGR01671 family)